MKSTFVLLFATTALTATVGVPAWSAMQSRADDGLGPFAALFEKGAQALPLVLVSDDDDEDDHGDRDRARRGHDDDDDDDDDDDCDDDDDDDDDCGGPARNPAPAGTVAPPQNGLIGNGAPPQVEVK